MHFCVPATHIVLPATHQPITFDGNIWVHGWGDQTKDDGHAHLLTSHAHNDQPAMHNPCTFRPAVRNGSTLMGSVHMSLQRPPHSELLSTKYALGFRRLVWILLTFLLMLLHTCLVEEGLLVAILTYKRRT